MCEVNKPQQNTDMIPFFDSKNDISDMIHPKFETKDVYVHHFRGAVLTEGSKKIWINIFILSLIQFLNVNFVPSKNN